MTDEALSALADAATRGPWRVEHNGAGEYYLLAQQGPMTVSPAEAHGASDAAFIAAARDAVPDLLARVAKAEERVKELEGALRQARETMLFRLEFSGHMPSDVEYTIGKVNDALGLEPPQLPPQPCDLTDLYRLKRDAEEVARGFSGIIGARMMALSGEVARVRAGRVAGDQPAFDATVYEQERLAIEFCNSIAGPKGKKGSPPDPVRLLEMARDLYRAEMEGRSPAVDDADLRRARAVLEKG